jgi:NADH-quinone oxidoreductase subunit H
MIGQFIVSVITILVIIHAMLLSCAYLILLERKVAAWTQNRIGPNRTNLSFGVLPFKGKHFGLGQALADGLKLLLKEDYTPPHVDRFLFMLAPVLVIVPALLGWAVIPWGGWYELPAFSVLGLDVPVTLVSIAAAPISIGVVYILAVGSLAVYGVVLGAYASNNKYAFFGGVRATAQMVSYEIPMGLCVLIAILTFQTTDAGLMSGLQAGAGLSGMWGIFIHPLLAVVFFICILAECNRAPFDLAEAEGELVGGYHTEYSSMKWALFFLGEYMHMITGSAFFCVLFLGGWDLIPFVEELPMVGTGWMGLGLVAAKFAIFAGKVAFLLFVMMWIRWTLPRFRFDQLMRLAWQGLIPMTLLVLLAVGTLAYLKAPVWTYLPANLAVALVAALVGPMLPVGPPVNRRIPMEGSRFSPPRVA